MGVEQCKGCCERDNANDFMTSAVEKKRIVGLDILKSIAIFFVVLYHTNIVDTVGASGFAYALNLVFTTVMSIAIPTFFFVSGYLLLSKRQIDLAKHYRKLLINVAVFVFWAITVTGILALYRHENMPAGKFFATAFGLVGTYTNYLWYFYAYLGLSVFYPLLLNLFRKHYSGFLTLFIVAAIVGWGIWLCDIVVDVLAKTDAENVIVSKANTVLGNMWIVKYAGYIVADLLLGGLCVKHIDAITSKKARIVITVSALLLLGALAGCNHAMLKLMHTYEHIWCNFMSPISALVVVALFVNLYGVKENVCTRILGLFGKYSFGIYIIHWIINALLEKFVASAGVSANASLPFGIAIALAYCIMSALPVVVLCKFKYTKALFLK